ncbi:MAG TPA: lanthionine synthetase LanC family protein [Candidatus Angelobacter sp.]|jgi:type 2 lantibiotic biosynthesis protein LanM|nr:lanthionine synthetase LanC family protein [Candidatus Angelobacter sp.]
MDNTAGLQAGRITRLAGFLGIAEEIGTRICNEAQWSGELCNWIGDTMAYEESRWQVVRRTVGPTLYSGASGIALFLAHLFRCAPEQTFRKTAEGAIGYVLSHVDKLSSAANLGFYSGLTGLAYVLSEMAEAFGVQQLADQSLAILRALSSIPVNPQQWDVVSGSAGMIPVLLKLHSRYGNQPLLDSALRHGDTLLQSASQSEFGWSWSAGESQPHNNLTGFAHGTAGVAWSLLELYDKTGCQRFFTAAQEAFRYERHWYNPAWENWPDFRTVPESGKPNNVVGWCHGACGIGLSRIRAFQLLGDQDCQTEAKIAVHTTTRALQGALSSRGNYSLCHGHCGNAELLLWAGDVLGDEASIATVQQIASDAVQKYSYEKNPWPCGVMNGGETPDLMLGLAGIGHFYLRLYDRQKIPSVLLVF